MKRRNGIGSGATKAGPLLLLAFRDFDEKKGKSGPWSKCEYENGSHVTTRKVRNSTNQQAKRKSALL